MGAETPVFSYEVTTRELAGLPDARGDSVKGMLASNYGVEVGAIRVILRYQVKADLTAEEAEMDAAATRISSMYRGKQSRTGGSRSRPK